MDMGTSIPLKKTTTTKMFLESSPRYSAMCLEDEMYVNLHYNLFLKKKVSSSFASCNHPLEFLQPLLNPPNCGFLCIYYKICDVSDPIALAYLCTVLTRLTTCLCYPTPLNITIRTKEMKIMVEKQP